MMNSAHSKLVIVFLIAFQYGVVEGVWGVCMYTNGMIFILIMSHDCQEESGSSPLSLHLEISSLGGE